MKQEDKELLLKDLCARLPYKVMGERTWTAPVTGSPEKGKTVFSNFDIEVLTTGYSDCGELGFRKVENYSFKPYLFPISSMTEEQKKEYYSLADDITIKPGHDCRLGIKIHCIKLGISDNPHEEVWDYINLDALDWLNKNHFDYRGLIEKGLAIDATELNVY